MRADIAALVGVVVRLQLGRVMGMIVRLQHVVGVIVLVTIFARRVAVAVAVLMRVRMGMCMRMFMAVTLCAMTMFMPVSVRMSVRVLMPVLVAPSHGLVSFVRFAPSFAWPISAPATQPFPYSRFSAGYAGGGRPATAATRLTRYEERTRVRS